jgi:putative ABC transport system permease protein
MNIFDLLQEAVVSLTLNKMRTALATLGIIIGTGSVIALISLGQASQKAVEKQIQSLGSNLLTVMPGSQNTGAVRGAAGSATSLTYADAKAIMAQIGAALPNVKNVSAEVSRRAQVVAGRNNANTQITGVVPAYAEIRKVNIASGVFIAQRDVENMTKVAVLGPTVVTDLFGEGADPVGQNIRVNNQSLKVIGVTVAKGGAGFQSPDDMIFVPLTTAQSQLFGVDYVSTISVEAVSADVMTGAQNEVGYFLLAQHKLTDPTKADFQILSQQDILGAANQITGTLTALLSGIAAISLVVGGIGIMNIMLVTVTERTREIGLRKALGAKRRVVVWQFLIEAIILTFAGGFLGIFLGAAVSYFVSSANSLPFTLAPHSVALALGVSGVIGLIFGWYPAQKASNLQPIEALRYE